MADPERIILEPAGDGERYRIRTEPPDSEGHSFKIGKFEVEPDGEDSDGNPLFRLSGDDAEGHGFRAFSDGRLKRDIRAI